MTVEEFEELVANALDDIPHELGDAMENVAVVVDDYSRPGRLAGLYQGIPLTQRGAHYSGSIPDRITIYMRAVCASCSNREEARAMVRRVVIHEVGHHFGIDDKRLKQLGW